MLNSSCGCIISSSRGGDKYPYRGYGPYAGYGPYSGYGHRPYRRVPHRVFVRPAPAYYYAPEPVYYAPEPVYYAPPRPVIYGQIPLGPDVRLRIGLQF